MTGSLQMNSSSVTLNNTVAYSTINAYGLQTSSVALYAPQANITLSTSVGAPFNTMGMYTEANGTGVRISSAQGGPGISVSTQGYTMATLPSGATFFVSGTLWSKFWDDPDTVSTTTNGGTNTPAFFSTGTLRPNFFSYRGQCIEMDCQANTSSANSNFLYIVAITNTVTGSTVTLAMVQAASTSRTMEVKDKFCWHAHDSFTTEGFGVLNTVTLTGAAGGGSPGQGGGGGPAITSLDETTSLKFMCAGFDGSSGVAGHVSFVHFEGRQL